MVLVGLVSGFPSGFGFAGCVYEVVDGLDAGLELLGCVGCGLGVFDELLDVFSECVVWEGFVVGG